ncbi:hypothetical protein VP120E341_P0090 [Vibrio phage 120E34-1]|nr:hypothetical protein VP120E341_P0090 [Vibrio phage 120E34-1]
MNGCDCLSFVSKLISCGCVISPPVVVVILLGMAR